MTDRISAACLAPISMQRHFAALGAPSYVNRRKELAVGAREQKLGADSVADSLSSAKNDNVCLQLPFRHVDAANPPERPGPRGAATKHTPCEALPRSESDHGFVPMADHGEPRHGVIPEFDSVDAAREGTG